MVRTRQSMLPGAKNTKKKLADMKASKITEATKAFNEQYAEMSDNKKQNLLDAGYNKDRLLKGYVNDSGANGLKAMMTNKDNFNTIAFKVLLSNAKKWLSSFKPK